MPSRKTTAQKPETQPIPQFPASEPILTIKELADRLKLKPSTIYGLTRKRNRRPKSVIVRSFMLAVILQAAVSAQTRPQPVTANLCDVFVSSAVYNQKVLSVEGILSPSFHSLFLSSPSCRSKEGLDLTTEAILPPSWESSPNGKQLRKFLHRGKSASVKLIGTFEADAHRYGPDGARFRFIIREISSVGKAPPSA